VAPQARTGRLVQAMMALVLQYLFEVRHLHVLIGRTPATMPLAIRMIRQAGFMQTWVCPNGTKDGPHVVDAVWSFLPRETWAAQQSEEG
jgi:hypothetical protein